MELPVIVLSEYRFGIEPHSNRLVALSVKTISGSLHSAGNTVYHSEAKTNSLMRSKGSNASDGN
jgi:hypothetical protein